jgi:hypothetical protein
MPSYRVTGASVSHSKYDVVGENRERPQFIAHVGLAAYEAVSQANAVAIIDMGPPLHVAGELHSIAAHAVGSAELTDDELQKMRTFIDQHAGEHASLKQLSNIEVLRRAPEMYCICPHAEPFCEEDGRYVRMRFGCAGFALEAYRYARVRLLDLDSLPAVDIDLLRTAYPAQVRLMEDGRLSADSLGLSGSGPWPVLLCGYLFHALSRSAGAIRESPYAPIAGDQFFMRETEDADEPRTP